jgi:hypothetical protein
MVAGYERAREEKLTGSRMDGEWESLASSGDYRAAIAAAYRRLADLGVALPPRPTRRDLWAAGIADADLRIDHFYLGSRRGTCSIQVSVRKTALRDAIERSRHVQPEAERPDGG